MGKSCAREFFRWESKILVCLFNYGDLPWAMRTAGILILILAVDFSSSTYINTFLKINKLGPLSLLSMWKDKVVLFVSSQSFTYFLEIYFKH